MAQRRLAAIMFSDIVGYTSLQKEDKKRAFDTRKKNRRIHKRLIKKFKGRWLKEMGGGILSSFNSNIDVVMCAISIQKAIEEIEIPLRIGIHQGDVIFEKKDVLGDGVNIASRIQNFTTTGGIAISEKVYSDISNKKGLDIEYMGKQSLKGVKDPVGLYKVSCRDEDLLDFSIDTGELVRPFSFKRSTIVIGITVIALLAFALHYFLRKDIPLSEPQKSILILPFENYLGSDTLDYLVAGMHNELIASVGRVTALSVKSRTTANTYKGSDKTIPEIADELDVNAIVATSVLCSGDSICLEVRVINTEEGEEQLWVKQYYEETSQILKLYNTITREISDEIDVNLRRDEELLLTESRSVNPDAYNAYLRGRLNLDIFTPISFRKAIEEFNKAIEIDPDWDAPYAGIAEVGAYQNQFSYGSRADNIILIYKNLNKALEIDPNSFYYHYTNAVAAAWSEFDWKKSEEEFRLALKLNPSHVRCRSFYAHLLLILRRTDEALHHGKISWELDPSNPFTLGLYGAVLTYTEKYQEALAIFENALSILPGHGFTSNFVPDAYYYVGDYDKWFKEWSAEVCWDDELKAILKNVFLEEGLIAVVKELLRLHKEYENEKCWMHDSGYFRWYWWLQDYEKVLDYLEIMYENDNHNPFFPYYSSNKYYNKMKDNPRYIAILKKMNLPVD